MKCNYCGREFEIGNRPDGLSNGVGFQTAMGIINICADCIIEAGRWMENEQSGTQTAGKG